MLSFSIKPGLPAASRLGAVVPPMYLAELQQLEGCSRVWFAWQPRGRAVWPACTNRPGLVTASSIPSGRSTKTRLNMWRRYCGGDKLGKGASGVAVEKDPGRAGA